MNTKSLDEATLIAYVDGELDAETSREVEAALNRDAEARKFVDRLREIDSLARAAFNHTLHEEVPERLLAAARGETLKSGHVVPFHARTPSSWRQALPMAAALAGLVIGAGGGLGYGQHEAETQFKMAALAEQHDAIAMDRSLNQALEVNLSGTPNVWHNPDTQRSAEFTPVRTYQDQTGRYCREYRKDVTEGGATSSSYGVACRTEDGEWKTRVLILDGGIGPSL